MKCIYCGKELAEGELFCPACGKAVQIVPDYNVYDDPFTAAVFLVFTLLYTPCVAAIASVKRELGGKWAVFVVAIQCVIAWLVAFAVHLAGIGLGIG